MAFEFNQFNVSGNLGRDAEIRHTPDGRPVVSFTICNNRSTKQDKKQLWLRCSWFGDIAEKLSEYLVKGTSVFLSGPIELREYQANDGTTKTSLEMIVDKLQLVPSGQREGDGEEREQELVAASASAAPLKTAVRKGRPAAAKQAGFDFAENDDDSIPF